MRLLGLPAYGYGLNRPDDDDQTPASVKTLIKRRAEYFRCLDELVQPVVRLSFSFLEKPIATGLW
ncbi:hypothetical protein DTJ15_01120 [Parasaccharibacter sp. TMW 2.1891]|nr:hypothetical protein [Parasaccharibacter sp. TMW 2.1891]